MHKFRKTIGLLLFQHLVTLISLTQCFKSGISDHPSEHARLRIRHHRQQPRAQRDGAGPVHARRQPRRLRPVHLVRLIHYRPNLY